MIRTQFANDPFFAVPTTTATTSAGEVELPIFYYDASNAVAVFAADPEGVAAKLAGTGLEPALRIGRRPVVVVSFYEYRQTAIGPYNEVGIGIPVYPKGKGAALPLIGWSQLVRRPEGRDQGAHIIDLPVTTEIADVAGRELWGYPKFVTTISFTLGGGHLSSTVEDPDDGSTIMEFSGGARPLLPVPPLSLVLYSCHEDTLLRANVDVRRGMRAHLPSGIRLKVGTSRHRMANNLRDLGLDGARPLLVASTTRFQSRLNTGVPVSGTN
jgi:Acetoacetate decarboxylase (ADC)